ncbi:hypothetical protein PISMIDRAFT_674956 [Pisolithus microcarpus 441]|uniref:Uncharacterized protein n=1 Tax=Pisolithus microcarpus 441 TaxID=765257 RepID=A0A0D0A694_9AGAM|nr:hypothetical protein PISMIDRAFT_684284 [Pisolithus microcarpus 441]KIK27563.1 hypothetical protein PISMIDRAFT_674956 [Pisolithus microcarpus 441]
MRTLISPASSGTRSLGNTGASYSCDPLAPISPSNALTGGRTTLSVDITSCPDPPVREVGSLLQYSSPPGTYPLP